MKNHFINLHCTISILAETRNFFFNLLKCLHYQFFLHVSLICRLTLEVQNLKEENKELQKYKTRQFISPFLLLTFKYIAHYFN